MNGVGPLSAVAEQIRAAAEEETRRRMTHAAPLPPPPIDIAELLKQWGRGVYERTVGFPEYMQSVPLPDISDITGGRAVNLAAGFVGPVVPARPPSLPPAPTGGGAVGPLEEFVGGLKREAGTLPPATTGGRLPTLEEQLASVARRAAKDPEAAAAARAQRQAAEQQTSARLAQERAARGGPVPQPQPRSLAEQEDHAWRELVAARERTRATQPGTAENQAARTESARLQREWEAIRQAKQATPAPQAPLKTGLQAQLDSRMRVSEQRRQEAQAAWDRSRMPGVSEAERTKWELIWESRHQGYLDAARLVRETRAAMEQADIREAGVRVVGGQGAPARAEQARSRKPAQFGTRAQQKKVQTLFQGIAAKHTPAEPTFQFGGKTSSSDIHELVKHHSTQKNPLSASIDEDYDTVTITNESTGGHLTIRDASKPYPYIRSTEAESAGKEQAGGKQMYQAALSWIANTGKTLDLDPGGISLINKLRKLENATSSYLRHGKEGYINLSNVTEARGLQQMMVASQKHVFSLRPDLAQNLIFNGEQFMNPAGTVLSDETLQVMIKARDPKFQQGIGVATLKRAAMTRWAMNSTKEDVIEAAKRFREPVLYSLAGLFVLKGQRRETD